MDYCFSWGSHYSHLFCCHGTFYEKLDDSNPDVPFYRVYLVHVTRFLSIRGIPAKYYLVPQSLAQWELQIEGDIDWTEGIFSGIGQIYFLDTILSGILLFIAVFWAGWKFGLYAILGNAVALLTAYGLGGEHSLILEGLYGYNSILACLAVAAVFNPDDHRFAPISGIVAPV